MPINVRSLTCLASLVAATATASPQSTLFVLDSARQELARSTTYANPLSVVGSTASLVEAADFDASGRTLWCVALDGTERVAGTLDLETGAFSRWSGPLALGPITAISAAPDSADWLLAEAHAGGARIWRGHLPTGTLRLLATLAGGGAVEGLAVGLDGAALMLRRDELFTLDRTTGASAPIGALAVVGATGPASALEFDWATGEVFTAFPSSAGGVILARLDPSSAAASIVGPLPGLLSGSALAVRRGAEDATSGRFCTPGAPNGAGQRGRIEARGSADVTRSDLVLTARDLPTQSFGLFLASRERATPNVPAGSVGSLCLGGTIARIAGGAQLLATGALGEFTQALELSAIPQPMGTTSVEAWERWSFQAWYRDSINGAATSNFTDAVHVTFTERFVSVPGEPTHGWRGIPEVNANDIEIGDVDGDGALDLVIAGTLTELIVRRGPLFEERREYSTGAAPRSLSLADMDGDGHLDVVTSADAQGRVWVHWNDGTGDLSTTSVLVACGLVGELSTADFDGDGRLDILAECEGGNSAVVLFNDGGRVFAARQFVQLQVFTGDVRAGDMNGDGLADIVGVSNSSDQVVFVHAVAGRAFTPPNLVASRLGTDLALADLDLDGRLDLVTVQNGIADIILHPGTNGGGLGPAITLPTVARPFSVAAADLDADGLPELITGYVAQKAISVHGNLGGLSFASEQSSAAGARTPNVAVADLNRDGRLDVAAVHLSITDHQVTVLHGTASGLEGRPVRIPLANEASTVTVADIDGDGETDLLLSATSGGGFELHRGDGTGRLEAPIIIGLPTPYTAGELVQVANLDRDGRLDIVAMTTDSNLVWTMLQTSLAPGVPTTFGAATSTMFRESLSGVALADIDMDLDLDLVGVGRFNGIAVALNDGSGSFSPPVPVYDPAQFDSIVVLDLDNDGWLDICGASALGRLAVMWGNGPASFDQSTLYGFAYKGIVAADFDNDGWLDLATPESGVHLRSGPRTFELHGIDHTSGAEAFAARDLDGDGLIDLTWTVPSFGLLGMVRNLGGGEFGHVNLIHPCQNPGVPALADLNHDGAPEIYIGAYYSSTLVVLPMPLHARSLRERGSRCSRALEQAQQVPLGGSFMRPESSSAGASQFASKGANGARTGLGGVTCGDEQGVERRIETRIETVGTPSALEDSSRRGH
ncbi:MAG: VCBS repeat-containing protein [Planctomycetota bacterium]